MNQRMFGYDTHRGQTADPHAAVSRGPHSVSPDLGGRGSNVDKPVGRSDAELHEFELRRAPGEESSVRIRSQPGQRRLDIRGAVVPKRSHRQPLSDSSTTSSNGANDVWIGGTAADVAAHEFTQFGVALGVTFADTPYRRHDLAGGTKSALQSVLFDKGALQWMKIAPLSRRLRW